MLLTLLAHISLWLQLLSNFWLSGFTRKPNASTLYAKPIKATAPVQGYCKNRKKPLWVVDKVLYLAAISGYGAGKVAELFNQRYSHRGCSVGKTFVYYQMKNQHYKIRTLRRSIKNKRPGSVPVNQTWGMDLTTVTLNKQQKLVL